MPNAWMTSFSFFMSLFHLSSVKWISKFSFEGQKDGKLKNCTKCRHLIYSYTPTLIAGISITWRFKGNVFFNILGIILLDNKSRLFLPLLTKEICKKKKKHSEKDWGYMLLQPDFSPVRKCRTLCPPLHENYMDRKLFLEANLLWKFFTIAVWFLMLDMRFLGRKIILYIK